ncbi:carbamoyl-phosphate synthase L chain, ATP binding domain-containing protein [Glomus cerebriforme]|uniref:Carbamoyl-phosphate synthase L chain, ATP binding domain-containing protein n=1 Tax=Glomus cerebriforme TaxID=658196 RepID=A0A397T5Z3_9GLOM|nr:carbamoyl-phosphate synthase L chain, ATP binding domain-containing protein [Glomus cerebriforme]
MARYTYTKSNHLTHFFRNNLISNVYSLNSNVPFTVYNRCFFSSTGRKPLLDKILIANRGEIACRVMRTAKKLGVKTVAVYSEADRHALHVKMADEAYLIGPAPSAESYLNMNKIISVAKMSNSQAIHPGYGFLSENSNFAELLAKEKITFIGPPASAIESMGSKSESKDIMIAANVPVVPGYHGTNQDPQFLKQKALEIGYPVLIKAIKGGGGKGMRIVNDPLEFDIQLESSKREAMKSFGDDQVLIEKYLLTPRHVEVQIFADTQGNVVHLFERDCSIQRRHQKILEEAPAPGLSDDIRMELGSKAVAAAKAVNYVGAGTVEFIMDNVDKKFYFMEMNTRLQVEHPVTEMVTSTDLVQWQLEIASGNPLPASQKELKLEGHAFEARIYAENPANNFLPDTGPLLHLRTPSASPNVRIETGFEQGDEINVHYDPMIAKLVVKGQNRMEAIRILKRALDEYEVVGLNTNIEFLKSVVSHDAFFDGEVETDFIAKHNEKLFAPKETPSHVIIQASLSLILSELQNIMKETTGSFDPFSPWTSLPFSRLNTNHIQTVKFRDHNNDDIYVKAELNNDNSFNIAIVRGISHPIVFKNVLGSWNETEKQIIVEIENYRVRSRVILEKNSKVVVFDNEGKMVLEIPEPSYLQVKAADVAGSIRTPMPCKISQILVKTGQIIEKGTPLIVLEAMKMEHLITSPSTGTIEKIFYNVGDFVEENKNLVNIAIENV